VRVDIAVAGAGIAGAAVACELAAKAGVALLEREDVPGYHSTGRSAAMLTLTYGTPAVRALAAASRAFLDRPPAGFCEEPLLAPRGMLHIARQDQRPALERAHREAAARVPSVRRLDRLEVLDLAPLLDPGYVAGGLLEPEARALDVARLHQGYLHMVAARGGRLITDAAITRIERRPNGWTLTTRAGTVSAGVLIDAAGAWADELAHMAGVRPVGLVPKRRTAILLDPPDGLDPAGWPMMIDIEEEFYIKPEGRQLLVSRADETPVAPTDVQPEELDVALAVERYRRATGHDVARLARRWAGLRSFVADKDAVIGPDPAEPRFVWLAGLGGFGIMTAPATARLCAAGVLRRSPEPGLAPLARRLHPGRLRRERSG